MEYQYDPVFLTQMERKRFPMPDLAGDALIRYVWDIEEVRDLMSIRAWYLANDLRKEEIEQLWVSEPEHRQTASFGTNWGFYVGIDAISAWYVTAFRARRHSRKLAYEAAHPGAEGDLSIGCCNMLPATTPLIRVAKDGKTARGIWYVNGQRTELNPDGVSADARWICGRLAVEFIREQDGWKIWHLADLNDMNYAAGTNYNDTPTYIPPDEDVMREEFGEPTIRMDVHINAFNWTGTFPRTPEPYDTYQPETGYGPEGHPAWHAVRKEVL